MAFQFSNANTPYYKPEAPELPGRVNMPQGDFVGNSIVNAFVHKAIADEQAQLQQKQMMQQADLQAQHLAYQDKWQTQDHDIAQQNADSLDKYRQAEAANFVSTKANRDAALKAKQEKDQAVKDLVTQFSTSSNALDQKSITAAAPLLDQQKILDDPGSVLKGIGLWDQQYGGAKVGATPTVEAQLKKIASDMQVPTVPGADYVDSKGNTSLTNTDDPLAWRVPGSTDKKTGETLWRSVQPGDVKQRQLQQVAAEYADPVNQRAITNQLIAAGHGTVEKTTETSGFDIWHPIATAQAKTGDFRKKTTVTDTPTLDPWANRLLLNLGAKQVQSQSHVPPALRYTPKQWMIKSGVGGTEAVTGGAGVDDIESERARAQQAIDMNPQNEQAIRAYFQQKNGEPL